MEEEFANAVQSLFFAASVNAGGGEAEAEIEAVREECPIESVSSFREAGVMTSNEGFVVRLVSGEEFQVTIVQSR